eukprot:865723-Pelagomonas_calceolata.AAC.3
MGIAVTGPFPPAGAAAASPACISWSVPEARNTRLTWDVLPAGDDGSVDARNLPHSRAGSLAPLKEESSAWEGEASAGASAPESPQQIQPMEQRQQQLEGGGHEQGGVGGPQSGAAPKEVGFEFEGQVLRKEGERQQQAGMSDIDAQDKKAEQQQQQAAERGQFAGQPDGQYVADEEGDAGKYGELGAQHIHSSSGLTSDFFEVRPPHLHQTFVASRRRDACSEQHMSTPSVCMLRHARKVVPKCMRAQREEQERLLQEQAAAAAAAETARQQEQLQEEWRQRDLADQRARQQLQWLECCVACFSAGGRREGGSATARRGGECETGSGTAAAAASPGAEPEGTAPATSREAGAAGTEGAPAGTACRGAVGGAVWWVYYTIPLGDRWLLV